MVLALNREYDQQIGRFFRVDPISEKFYYLSPYQYCSNDPIKNVDLDGAEGLDFRIWTKLIENTVKNPNGKSAKVLGIALGVGGSIENNITSFFHLLPIGNTWQNGMKYYGVAQSLGKLGSQNAGMNGADYFLNLISKYSVPGSGEKFNTTTIFAAISHGTTDIVTLLLPVKQLGVIKGKAPLNVIEESLSIGIGSTKNGGISANTAAKVGVPYYSDWQRLGILDASLYQGWGDAFKAITDKVVHKQNFILMVNCNQQNN